uniref:Uncharacterized protein n=1 Tax=Tanacetum cinerariifolium TaxID=118510 RepID=A0A699HMT0_TANCI|nr:hypothetical protein [Tanacetum cinerariifolium]
MAADPNDVRRTTLRRPRQELVADVELANSLLHELNRYMEQLCTRASELLRMEALPDSPLIKHGFSALERANFFDMTNSNNLMVQAVEDVVQHEPHFILEIVDISFGSLAMRGRVNLRSMRVLDRKRLIKRNEDKYGCGSNGELGGVEKVKALGANVEVSGSRVRVVWMVVDGGNVRARLVSKEVAKVVFLLLLLLLLRD